MPRRDEKSSGSKMRAAGENLRDTTGSRLYTLDCDDHACEWLSNCLRGNRCVGAGGGPSLNATQKTRPATHQRPLSCHARFTSQIGGSWQVAGQSVLVT